MSVPALAAQPIDPKVQARIDRILKRTPLIDGHNDIAEPLSENHGSSVANLAERHRQLAQESADDRHGAAARRAASAGNSGRSISTATITGDEAIRQTIEQIDIVKRMIAAYPRDLEQAYTADDIVRIHRRAGSPR